MHTTTGIRGKFCAELVCFFIVFGESKKITFKNALDEMPVLSCLDYWVILICLVLGSESRKRYTLGMLLICLERDFESSPAG